MVLQDISALFHTRIGKKIVLRSRDNSASIDEYGVFSLENIGLIKPTFSTSFTSFT